jgi:multimeric flavodoxin WrbA
MASFTVRKDMPGVELSEAEFKKRYRQYFFDPAFDLLQPDIERITEVAWQAYSGSRKAPQTRRAGETFAEPDYQLSVEWIAASERIKEAERRQKDPATPSHILLINGASRSEHTCPGESSKTWRLVTLAREIFAQEPNLEVEILDLSRLTSEYGRTIYPCKTCVSTAMPLCHWPCSCYPNHALGQVHDWMNDIYSMWAAAHGVMIICPVNWYGPPSGLKLMMDRLVCADGGNPDPTLTAGKKARLAKQIELEGWDYPRHLQGRLFSVVVHGDVEGAENVRRSLSDWLCFMHMVPAGSKAELDRYIGYWQPYATSHDELDRDTAMQQEVANAAVTLADAVVADQRGELVRPGDELAEPRQK